MPTPPTFPHFPRFAHLAPCPLCHPAPPSCDDPPPLTLRQYRRIVACPRHARVVLLAGDVELGLRSDWYRAPDGMARNHAAMMRLHPREVDPTDTRLHSWLAEVPAILAWYNVRLWDEPDDPWESDGGDADKRNDAA